MKTSQLCTPLLLALSIHAATSHGASPKLDETALAEMRKGQTTYAEIVRRYGRPDFSSTNWDGERTAAYSYGEGWSPSTLSALGAALGSSGSDTVVLQFDGKGLLTDYRVNRAAAKAGEAPAIPTVRYVEPSFGATKPAPPAKPAAASAAVPVEAKPLASAPVEAAPLAAPSPVKPAAAQATSTEPRGDGLPWWLPSTSTRGADRY